jgi:hypothetical protein
VIGAAEQSSITLSYRQGVAIEYHCSGGHWTESRFERGRLRAGPDRLQLRDVLGRLYLESDRERACAIDPAGAAALRARENSSATRV